MLLLLLLYVCAASAARPSQLHIFCNATDKAEAWIQGAQTSATLVVQTLLGGFLCNGNVASGCFENAAQIDATLCLSTDGPTCDDCHLDVHFNITENCCDDEPPAPGEPPHNDGDLVCRTVRQWIALSFSKLYEAHTAFAAGDYALAHDLACAAESALSQVLTALGSPFVADGATYKHIITPAKRATFTDIDQQAVAVVVRTVQAFRQCGDTCGDHRLIATYTLFQLDNGDSPLPVGITQLLWPISGTLSAFHKTGLPHNAFCSLSQEPAGIVDTVADYRMPTLGHLDFARIVSGYTRCDGFPVSGCVQGFHDLAAERCCNTLPLIKDVGDLVARAPRTDDTPASVFAFAYVAHFRSAISYESLPTRDIDVGSDLVLRIAASDQCTDKAVNSVVPAAVQVVLSTRSTIMTLGPGESRCVGGSDAGKPCTARNECGAPLACTAKPGTKTLYCFDGVGWNQKMPCSPASQCPYGECYGAVSGDAGGAFPFRHVWDENNCDDPASATQLCFDPRVREWYATPSRSIGSNSK